MRCYCVVRQANDAKAFWFVVPGALLVVVGTVHRARAARLDGLD